MSGSHNHSDAVWFNEYGLFVDEIFNAVDKALLEATNDNEYIAMILQLDRKYFSWMDEAS